MTSFKNESEYAASARARALTLDCLDVKEVAARLRVSPKLVLRLLHAKRLPGAKFGRVWRVPRIALEAHLRRMAELHGEENANI